MSFVKNVNFKLIAVFKKDNRIGQCSGCKKTTYIQNKTKNFCQQCIYRENHQGKNQIQVQIEKQRNKEYIPKEDNERQMFLEIWEERSHICENCKKNLGGEPKAQFFSHIKPKSTHPHLRLKKGNVRLLCFDCHYSYDFGSKETFNKLKLIKKSG